MGFKEQLQEILLNENVPLKEHLYEKCPTYIMQKDGDVIGFFTFRIEKGYPHLLHFIVDKKYRTPWNALALIRKFEKVVRQMGYKRAIIHVKDDRQYLDKFIQWYFRVKPYAYKDGFKFYFVGVKE